MKTLILFTFAITIGLLLPGGLEAVDRCYKCFKEEWCNDPFEPGNSVVCWEHLGNAFCGKFIFGTSVWRTCMKTCEEYDTKENGIRDALFCCKTDNCNTGMMTSFDVILIMTSLLMAYFTRERF